jgi:hypothetical protein
MERFTRLPPKALVCSRKLLYLFIRWTGSERLIPCFRAFSVVFPHLSASNLNL